MKKYIPILVTIGTAAAVTVAINKQTQAPTSTWYNPMTWF